MKKIWIGVIALVVVVACIAVGVVIYTNNNDDEAHSHDYVETIVGATCVEGGYTLHKCSCGEEYKDNEVAPLGHNYADISYAWDTTCIQCIATAICGRENCENTYSLPSSNIVSEIIKEASCNEVGERKYTATFSDNLFSSQEKSVEIDKLSHSLVHTEAKNASCTEDGNIEYWQCNLCNTLFADEKAEVVVETTVVSSKGHTIGDIEYSETDFCGENPLGEAYCAVCEEYLGTFGHHYTSQTTPASCEEDGYTIYTCTKCNDTYTITISATGHFTMSWETTSPASCTTDGTAVKHCLSCEQVVETSTIDCHGHRYTTYQQDRSIVYTCVYCDDTYSEIVEGNIYVIQFVTDGGTTVDSLALKEGESVDVLPTTSKEGAIFSGWYLDSERTQKYVITPISANTTLFAKWDYPVIEDDIEDIVRDVDVNYSFVVVSPTPLNDDNVNEYITIKNLKDETLDAKIKAHTDNEYEVYCEEYEEGGQYFIEVEEEVTFKDTESKELWVILNGEKESKVKLKDGVKSVSVDELFGVFEAENGYFIITYNDILNVGDKVVFYDGGIQDYQIGVKVLAEGTQQSYHTYQVEVLTIEDLFEKCEIYYSDTVNFEDVEINSNLEEEIQAAFLSSDLYSQYTETVRLMARSYGGMIDDPIFKIKTQKGEDAFFIKITVAATVRDLNNEIIAKSITFSMDYNIAVKFDVDFALDWGNSTMLLTTDMTNSVELNVKIEGSHSLTGFDNVTLEELQGKYQETFNYLRDMGKRVTADKLSKNEYGKTFNIGTMPIKPGLLTIYIDVGAELDFSMVGGIGMSYSHRIESEIGLRKGQTVSDFEFDSLGFTGYMYASAELYGGVHVSFNVGFCGFTGYIKGSIGLYAEIGGAVVIAQINDESYADGTYWFECGLRTKLQLGFKYEWNIWFVRITFFDLKYTINGPNGWEVPFFKLGDPNIPFYFDDNSFSSEDDALLSNGTCGKSITIDLNEQIDTDIMVLDIKELSVYSKNCDCSYVIELIYGDKINSITLSPEGKVTISGIGDYILKVTVKYNEYLYKDVYIKGEFEHDYSDTTVSDDSNRTQASCIHKATYWYSCIGCGELSNSTYFESGDYANHTMSQEYSIDGDSHWYECEYPGCDYTDTKISHQGGSSTCYSLAICVDCGIAYGEYASHDFSVESTDERYRCSVATCSRLATYYYSCSVCEEAGETTFEFGELLPHKYADELTCHDRKCINCEHIEVATTPHIFSGWLEVDPGICGGPVYNARVCYDCGYYEDDLQGGVIHPHNYVSGETYPATCTDDGLRCWVYCSKCGFELAKEIVPALQHQLGGYISKENGHYKECTRPGCDYSTDIETHTTVKDAAVPSTCLNTGLTEGSHCGICEYIIVAQHITSALGHNLECYEAQEPTYTSVGWDAYEKCTRCDYSTYNEIPQLTHNMTHYAAVSATCTTDGNVEYWHCSDCNKNYDSAIGTNVVDDIVIPKLGHDITHFDYVAPSCTTDGHTAYDDCTRCDYQVGYEKIDALDHDEQHHDGQPATCTEAGWEDYVTCSRCDYSTYKVIAAKGHSYTNYVSNNNATCEADGTKTASCDRNCGATDTKTDVGSKLGHNCGEWYETEAATCTEMGTKHRDCSRCDYYETGTIDKLDHDEQHHDGQPATCTETGWEDYVTCSRCDYSTYKVIAAKGHSYTNYVSNNNATCEADGKKKRVTNKEETIAVRERQKKLQEAFRRWIFDDPQRREYLVAKYNEIFNTTVVPQYDGSYLQFPGMNPEITLKPYQKDAVARILMGDNTLLHHSVGAGKTFEIAAACMKLREIGTAQKPIIVVPNHLVVQWANEFRTLYPNANLLMATKKDFEKTSRKRFVAKVATGDWDAVIIAMSSFERVPISKERQEERLNREIDMIERAIVEEKENENKRHTVKDLQRTLKNKRALLEKLTAEGKKDDLLKFEDLGVDYLFVDEAHKYKNKFIFTRMNNVSGISRAMSQRSTDMDMKCELINEMRGGDKGVVFATGTPISNSLVEMFTLQTYLQRRELEERGLQFFDTWAANFTETITALELAPSGQGYRSKTRVAKFKNLPELLKMYRSFADVKTADMLHLPVPDANRYLVEIEPTDDILSLNDLIVERSEAIAGGGVKPNIDNMLCVTHDGKMIALDPRCYDPSLPDRAEHKVNVCIGNIYKIWSETQEARSTQIVFCDMSTPKKNFEDYDPTQDFDVYNDIKVKLVNLGVPKDEVAFIHDAKTDQQKQDLFDRVRRGEIRVLIGSTEKCGAGTNIQNKLVALHHLDTPYRPSDLEQREGRIVRQGNENESVAIYTYVTKRTFDAYSYQLLESKQRFISQINKGDYTIREADDIDEATLSYAEVKAIVSDNPKIRRKMEIEQQLGQLSVLEKDHRNNRYRMQEAIIRAPEQIGAIVRSIENLKADVKTRDLHKGDQIQIGKQFFEERKDAGALLIKAVKSGQYVGKTIGYFRGFGIVPTEKRWDKHYLKLVGNGQYEVEISDSDVGTISRMENVTNDFEKEIKYGYERKERAEQELIVAKSEVDKPFEHQSEMEALQSELAEINAELDLGHTKENIVLEDETGEVPKIEILDESEEEVEIA